MSDNKNMQVSDDALNSVAGGIGDVINTGNVNGDQIVVDNTTTTKTIDNSTKVGGDVVGGNKTEGDKTTAGGDITGGNKTDVDTKIDTTVNYTKRGGLF